MSITEINGEEAGSEFVSFFSFGELGVVDSVSLVSADMLDLWLYVGEWCVCCVEEEVEAFAEDVVAVGSVVSEVVDGGDFVGGGVGVVGDLVDEFEESAVGVGKVEVVEGVLEEVLFEVGVFEGEGFVGVGVQWGVGVGVAVPEVEGVVDDCEADAVVGVVDESEAGVEVGFDFVAVVVDGTCDGVDPAGAVVVVGAEFGEEDLVRVGVLL
jgi:hypothetical protein